MSFIYKSFLKITDDKAALKVEQRQWLQSRDAYGDNFGGLYTSMAMRLNAMADNFNFLRCFQARYEIDLKTCSMVFSTISTAPIPVKLTRIGDGLTMDVEYREKEFSGLYSEDALDFIYSWEEDKIVFYIWSPDTGVKVFNPRSGEATSVGLTLPHPITLTFSDFCEGWATDTGGSTFNFCLQNSLDLWKLELDRKLSSHPSKEAVKKHLFQTLNLVQNDWQRLKLIEILSSNVSSGVDEVIPEFLPSATDLLINLPICMFRSSLGPMCPRDEDGRASFRIFSKQNILNMDFSDQEAAIETDDWFYSISGIEADQQGFKFTFTDDAKIGTYLVAEDFFVEWNEDKNGWEIIGHEITYISGEDQSNVGKFLEFNEPIPLKGI